MNKKISLIYTAGLDDVEYGGFGNDIGWYKEYLEIHYIDELTVIETSIVKFFNRFLNE